MGSQAGQQAGQRSVQVSHWEKKVLGNQVSFYYALALTHSATVSASASASTSASGYQIRHILLLKSTCVEIKRDFLCRI